MHGPPPRVEHPASHAAGCSCRSASLRGTTSRNTARRNAPRTGGSSGARRAAPLRKLRSAFLGLTLAPAIRAGRATDAQPRRRVPASV